MTPSSRLWVLGASDPEMARIEDLLREGGERVAYASARGTRVTPATAYQADRAVDEEGRAIGLGQLDLVLVECALPARAAPDPRSLVDHHRPGDPGYGRPPAEFLAGSSLGQVISVLARLGRLPVWELATIDSPALAAGDLGWEEDGGWQVGLSGARAARIPDDLVLAAAADHCLAAAYRGRCPGIRPGVLRAWRIWTRADYQGRSMAEVERDVRRAEARLLAAPRVQVGEEWAQDMRPGRGAPCGAHGPSCPGEEDGCWGDVPELPEAAAFLGLPFLAIPRPGPDGRRKLVLQAASAAAVEAFLRHHPGGYGDPARGLAGVALSR